jgi:hypothetical protein
MAASIVTDSDIQTPFNDNSYCFSRFNYAASGDTVAVPRGCQSAAVLVATGTAPTTTTITAGVNNDTVTCTGGTLGNGLVMITRHGGNPASAR